MKYRTRVQLLSTLCLLLAPTLASAQAYPNRPIRIVVPYAAGGQPDVVARVVAKQMSVSLGQPITIENISGGSGVAAITSVISSPADGYSLIVLDAGHWAINPAARTTALPYDPVRSFTPVGLLSTSSLFLAVHESVPAKTLPELVSLIKEKPGVLNYGSSGIGSVHHLTIEAMKQSLGLNVVHVPFRGTSQSVPALVGNQVQMVVASLTGLAQFENAGRIRILGANTIARSPLAPHIPPISDVAPSLDFPGQVGLLGPAGMPGDVVARISAAIADAVKSPDVVTGLKSAGVEPAPSSTPETLTSRIRDDGVRYGALIKATGIKLE